MSSTTSISPALLSVTEVSAKALVGNQLEKFERPLNFLQRQ